MIRLSMIDRTYRLEHKGGVESVGVYIRSQRLVLFAV